MLLEKFWLILAAACVLWYSTITIFVAFKGAYDIREMLDALGKQGEDDGDAPR